jgi:DNA-binding CsgD family transcriptional regulator
VEAIGEEESLVFAKKNHYVKEFQRVDPFAAYLNTNFPPEIDNLPAVVKSSEVFGTCYTQGPYYKFLSSYNSAWALSLPIDGYRLTLYKSIDDEDFTQDEASFFESLSHMLYSKYKSKNKIDYLLSENEIKNSLLNDMSIGYVLLDENFQVINCNEIAAYYISDATQTLALYEGCRILLNKLEQYGNRHFGLSPCILMPYKGYQFKLKTHICNNNFEMLSCAYTITVKKADSPALHDEDEKSAFARRHSLSPREMEVIELIARGETYDSAAQQLYISLNTVRTHIKSIYKKVGINNQRALVELYCRIYTR